MRTKKDVSELHILFAIASAVFYGMAINKQLADFCSN